MIKLNSFFILFGLFRSNMRKKILNIIHNTNNDYVKKKYASEFRLVIQLYVLNKSLKKLCFEF